MPLQDVGATYFKTREEDPKGNTGIEVEVTGLRLDNLHPYEQTATGLNLSDDVARSLEARGLGHLRAAEAKPAQLETGDPTPSRTLRNAVDTAIVCSTLMAEALREIGDRDHVPLISAWGVPPVDTPLTMDGFSKGMSTMYKLYSLWIMERTQAQGGNLATSGIHRNHRIPIGMLEKAALASDIPPEKFNEFISYTYLRLARGLAADEAVFRGVTASTPFGAYKGNTVLRPEASFRAASFPAMDEAINYPRIYDSREAYHSTVANLLREDAPMKDSIILPGSMYTGIRPKPEGFGGRVISFKEFMGHNGFSEEEILDHIRRAEYNPQMVEMFKAWARANQRILFEGDTFNRLELRYPEDGKSREQMYQEMVLEHMRMLWLFSHPDECAKLTQMDPAIVRANNQAAIRDGLDAKLVHPLTGKEITGRERLAEIIKEMNGLHQQLQLNDDISMMSAMAGGAPTTSETLRARILSELGPNPEADAEGNPLIPTELMRTIYEEVNRAKQHDFEAIRARMGLEGVFRRAGEIPARAQDDLVQLVASVTRAQIKNDLTNPRDSQVINLQIWPDQKLEWDEAMTKWVVDRTQEFIKMGAVSTGNQQSLEAIQAACDHYCQLLEELGLSYSVHHDGEFPYVEILPLGENDTMFMGHLDVVEIQKNNQFDPEITTDAHGQRWMKGRGSADMITSALNATRCLAQAHKAGLENIPGMLIVFNEENGELDTQRGYESIPTGTRHWVAQKIGTDQEEPLRLTTFIALERTCEPPMNHPLQPHEMVGEIADKSRGAVVLTIQANAIAAHAGGLPNPVNLTQILPELQQFIIAALEAIGLTTRGGFTDQIIPGAIQSGFEDGNTLSISGFLEIAVRPTPSCNVGNVQAVVDANLTRFIEERVPTLGRLNLKARWKLADPGPSAPRDNSVLQRLADSIAEEVSPEAVKFQNKPHASSARITTKMLETDGLVWSPNGGVFPHGSNEAVLIDSIPVGAKVLMRFIKKSNASQLIV